MKKSSLWLAVISAIAVQSAALSTTAIASESTRLETQKMLLNSDLVFAGKVVDIQYKDSTDGLPYTFVTYRVEDVISGQPDGDQVTLRFLGGRQQKGEVIRYLDVSETPEFIQGDSDVLFVKNNTKNICPLVDCLDGRFRNRDGVITSDDGRAVIDAGDDKTYAVSSLVINTSTGEKETRGIGKTSAQTESSDDSKIALTSVEPIKTAVFIADLKAAEKAVASVRSTPTRFLSASLKEEFKGPDFTPVKPQEAAPTLLRRNTTQSDFDRWEEAALEKNNGNPVIQ